MKLSSCPRCERHVLVEAASCPFCGTRLGTTSAIGRAMATMIAAVGLSISCGGDDTGDTSDTVANTQGPTTEGPTTEGPTSTSSPVETDEGGADYAGPDTSLSAGPESSTSGEGPTSSDSGTTGDTETDTGSGTDSSGSDSGGVDYAGPGPGPVQH